MDHRQPHPDDQSQWPDPGRQAPPSGDDRTAVYAQRHPQPTGQHEHDGYTDPIGFEDRPEPRFGNSGGQPPSDQTRNIVFAAVAGLMLVVLVGLAVYLATNGNDRVEADALVVPLVIGETQAAATNRLTDAGFAVTVEFREDDGEPGTVFAQVPEAGTEHDPADPVTLFIVIGGETATVPNVVDRQTEAAQTELTGLGFTVRVVEEPSDEVDEGRVIRQSIQAGQDANIGSEITITVSSGSNTVEVPDLINQSQANAEQMLLSAGLVPQVEFVDVQADAGTVGQVIGQTPAPSEPAAPGTNVVVKVGRATEAAAATTTTTTQTTTTTEPTTTASTSTTVPPALPVGPFPDPRSLLLAFGEAWTDGDWDRMRTMASADVVSLAQEFHSDDGMLLIDDGNVDDVLERCTSSTPDTASCEVLYGPAEGNGLIFTALYTNTADGYLVTELSFDGDAG